MVSNCLQALYQRLHGPEADYRTLIRREELTALLLPIVTESPILESDGTESEEGSAEDERARVSTIVRQLTDHGWIESIPDKGQLVSVYRLTRPGKAFTEGFVKLEGRGIRSRQRNVRNTRYSLEVYANERDPFNLIDALTTAGQINSDLSDDIDVLHQRRTELLRNAAGRYQEAFEDFLDYMRKHFIPDLAVRLSADSIERHRSAILRSIEQIRGWSGTELDRETNDLTSLFPDVNVLGVGNPLLRVLERIENLVDTACDGKMPELRNALAGFVRQADVLIRQAQAMSFHVEGSPAMLMERLGQLGDDAQSHFFDRVGPSILPPSPSLLDPAKIGRLTTRSKRKIDNQTSTLPPTREELLAAALASAREEAFAITIPNIRGRVIDQLGDSPSIHIRDFHVRDALDLLTLSHCIEIGAIGYPNEDPSLAVEPILEEGKPVWTDTPYGKIEAFIIRREFGHG
ncbi:MAG: Wadjet anti-phage system protein JetA family protein [Candidatus Thiodiazotropha endolucinida]